MTNLAYRLSEETEDVERDVVRALALFEREIELSPNYNVMNGLANILIVGTEVVERYVVRGVVAL